jgi:hypothetical protein
VRSELALQSLLGVSPWAIHGDSSLPPFFAPPDASPSAEEVHYDGGLRDEKAPFHETPGGLERRGTLALVTVPAEPTLNYHFRAMSTGTARALVLPLLISIAGSIVERPLLRHAVVTPGIQPGTRLPTGLFLVLHSEWGARAHARSAEAGWRVERRCAYGQCPESVNDRQARSRARPTDAETEFWSCGDNGASRRPAVRWGTKSQPKSQRRSRLGTGCLHS